MNKYKIIFFFILSIFAYNLCAQQTPQIVVQSSHSAVDGIYLSPDGNFILSHGDDEFKIWEFNTGRLLAFHPLQKARQILWKADNRSVIFIHSNDNGLREIKEWKWEEDKIVRLEAAPEVMPWDLVKDEKQVYSAYLKSSGSKGNIKLVLNEIETNITIVELSGPSQYFYNILGISIKDRLVITDGESDGNMRTVYTWDSQANRIINKIELPGDFDISETSISVTPGCEYIVINGHLKTKGSVLMVFNSLAGEKLIDKRIPENIICYLNYPLFDNKKLLVALNDFKNKSFSIKALGIEDETSLDLLESSFPIRCFQMTKDEKAILIGANSKIGNQSSLTLYYFDPIRAIKKGFLLPEEVQKHQPIGIRQIEYGAKSMGISGVYGSRNNDYFILDVSETIAHKWSILQAMPVKQFYVDSSGLSKQGFSLSENGELLCQYYKDNSIVIKQLETREYLQIISNSNAENQLLICAVSHDEHSIITGYGFVPKLYGFFEQDENSQNNLQIRTNVNLWNSGESTEKFKLDYGVPVYKVGFSHDDKLCYACIGNRKIEKKKNAKTENLNRNFAVKIWETKTGKLFFEHKAGIIWEQGDDIWMAPVCVLALSDNNQFLSFFSLEGNECFFNICDLIKKEQILKKAIDLNFMDCAGNPASLVFDSAANNLVLGTTSSPPYLRLIQVSTGETLHVFEEQTAPVSAGGNAIGLYNNDDYLVTVGQDNKLRLYSMVTKKLLTTSMIFDDGNWITWTPYGYFQGSVEASDYIAWKYNNKLFAFEQFRNKFYDPELIRNTITNNTALKSNTKLPSPPSIKIASPQSYENFPTSNCYVKIVAEDDIEVKEIRLFLNGRPIIERSGNVKLRDTQTLLGKRELSGNIALLDRYNNIEAVAYDNEGNKSAPVSVSVYSKPDMALLPNLFVISIGVGNYADPLPDLPAACNDAKSIAEAFLKQKGKVYHDVYAKTLIDQSASTEKITEALTNLPVMTQEDIVVIFMAGHGVQDNNGIYYFCSSGTQMSNLENTALYWEKFEKTIANFTAGKVILFLDTCHSGDFLGRVSGDRFAENIAKYMAVVFTSCKGVEYSIEDSRLQHGIFTYALLEGIDGQADLTGDGKITMSELKTYIEDKVPSLARNYQMIQTPFTPRLERYTDFTIASIY